MGPVGESRTPGRWSRIGLTIVPVATAATLVAIPLVDRSTALYLGAAYTPGRTGQETPQDVLQPLIYVVALAVCVVMAVRLRRRGDRLPIWTIGAAAVAWLLWRELPFDERWLGCNTFSWRTYASHAHDAPLWVKAVFLVGSIGFTLGLVIYVAVKRRVLLRLVRERVWSVPALMTVLAALSLVAAQMLDKHRMIDRRLGADLSAWDLRDYCEESLETLGPVLLVTACLLTALGEPGATLSDGSEQV